MLRTEKISLRLDIYLWFFGMSVDVVAVDYYHHNTNKRKVKFVVVGYMASITKIFLK